MNIENKTKNYYNQSYNDKIISNPNKNIFKTIDRKAKVNLKICFHHTLK
jgi:hypothetical protein